jgi:hypothetical protein
MRYISTRPAFGNHAITLLYIYQDDIKTYPIEVGVKWLRIVTNGGMWHRRKENLYYSNYSVILHKSFHDAEEM